MLLLQLLKINILLLLFQQQHGVKAQMTCRTPRSLSSDFMSSCEQLSISMSTCSAAWGAFSGAFSGRDPSAVTASDYDPYFNLFPIQGMADQFLFWSRTPSLVNLVSMMNSMGINIVSSANLPSSEIINDLGSNVGWCGNQGGINFDTDCNCSARTQFWKRFSFLFARAAEGVTFFLTDGKEVAFNVNNFFSTVELPNMRAGSVTRVVALIIHNKGSGESCSDTQGSSSVITLRNRVQERNFAFDCFDIYGEVGDMSQTRTIADCTLSTISKVQQGLEGNERQIECVSGTVKLESSVTLLFLISLSIISMIIFSEN